MPLLAPVMRMERGSLIRLPVYMYRLRSLEHRYREARHRGFWHIFDHETALD
jgi:hypothetical protein